jgi:hypothetical protein
MSSRYLTLSMMLRRNKAVSDGAVSSYLNSIVTARIARFSYGVMRNVEYDPNDPEHWKREEDILCRPSGRKLVPNGFEIMLAKVCPLTKHETALALTTRMSSGNQSVRRDGGIHQDVEGSHGEIQVGKCPVHLVPLSRFEEEQPDRNRSTVPGRRSG